MTAESGMKKLTIRLDDDQHARLAALAKANQRSVNKQVIWIIEQVTSGQKSQNTAHGTAEKNKGSAV